ncbi:hypothetical protein KKC94_02870 [Patescibacteria group bacterium]|nr:hypothetical protein [Patescibacteria group bacterium]
MNIFDMFSQDACSLGGKDSIQWTWREYYENRSKLESEGRKVVLVNMIEHPVAGSTPISNELFQEDHPDGTYFVLYCHSGGTSGYMQKKLSSMYPNFNFVNMSGGIGMYEEE